MSYGKSPAMNILDHVQRARELMERNHLHAIEKLVNPPVLYISPTQQAAIDREAPKKPEDWTVEGTRLRLKEPERTWERYVRIMGVPAVDYGVPTGIEPVTHNGRLVTCEGNRITVHTKFNLWPR